MKITEFNKFQNIATTGKRWARGKLECGDKIIAFKYEEDKDRIRVVGGKIPGNDFEKRVILNFLLEFSRNEMKGGTHVDFGKSGKPDCPGEIPYV